MWVSQGCSHVATVPASLCSPLPDNSLVLALAPLCGHGNRVVGPVIILDTHIWVWWVHGDACLPDNYQTYVAGHETQGLGVSVISCWEVAKLVEYGRLTLPLWERRLFRNAEQFLPVG